MLKGKWLGVTLGASSGFVWFLIALTFDKGVRDFNYPVIPTAGLLAIAGSLLAAILTGVSISLLFQRCIQSRSMWLHLALPLITVPTAITIFSVLVWVVWLLLGRTAGVQPLGQLANTLGFFLIYGLCSIFAPFLYVVAALNNWTLHEILKRAT
jgi:hypothetical protein